MITYCLNCGAENDVRIHHDSLGSHCVCPICESSYPVDDPHEGVSNLAWHDREKEKTMKYYVLYWCNLSAKSGIEAFADDYEGAHRFACKTDGELIGISDGVPTLWPDPEPVRFQTFSEVLES